MTETAPETDGGAKLPRSGRRILIVDDEKLIREVFLRVVSSGLPDCRIDVAVNGAEAVESFRTARQSVLVMDVKMPVMDGETAFNEIQKLCESENWEMPSVIFCTGYDLSGVVRDMVENSAKHCLLMKPIRNWQLIKEIQARLPSL